MAELVTLQMGRIFTDFEQRMLRLRDVIVSESAQTIRREYESSIRQRWFKSGATLSSLKEQFIVEGDSKFYRLWPTATNKGAPYPLFGEYGTGRRGALTGQSAPAGYRYGDRQGMRARRFTRIAVGVASPQVRDLARLKVKQFAQGVTVS